MIKFSTGGWADVDGAETNNTLSRGEGVCEADRRGMAAEPMWEYA